MAVLHATISVDTCSAVSDWSQDVQSGLCDKTVLPGKHHLFVAHGIITRAVHL